MRKKALIGVFVSSAVLCGLWLAYGSVEARSASECSQVNGRLFDEHVGSDGVVGRMVGGINGTYRFTDGVVVGTDPEATVRFGSGNATIDTKMGVLRWHESSTLDYTNEDDYSTTVLATVKGGTGAWSGASGHVIMSGYFHLSTLTGQFDYSGTICTG
jgi:hypothetical protein